jgi:hypothetical protein
LPEPTSSVRPVAVSHAVAGADARIHGGLAETAGSAELSAQAASTKNPSKAGDTLGRGPRPEGRSTIADSCRAGSRDPPGVPRSWIVARQRLLATSPPLMTALRCSAPHGVSKAWPHGGARHGGQPRLAPQRVCSSESGDGILDCHRGRRLQCLHRPGRHRLGMVCKPAPSLGETPSAHTATAMMCRGRGTASPPAARAHEPRWLQPATGTLPVVGQPEGPLPGRRSPTRYHVRRSASVQPWVPE